MKLTITITGDEKVIYKITRLDNIETKIRAPMEESLALLQRTLARQPRKAAGAFSVMATPKQKRAFWAKMRDEPRLFDPRTGYRRTRVLANSWTTKITSIHNGLDGTVGTNTPYAIYVHGSGVPGQQPFHAKSNFVREDHALEMNERKIKNIFNMAIARIVNAP